MTPISLMTRSFCSVSVPGSHSKVTSSRLVPREQPLHPVRQVGQLLGGEVGGRAAAEVDEVAACGRR